MLHRTRVKICGITSVEDARTAVEAGADAIGLVFYRGSPRYVSIENAARIAQSLPAFVSAVGLFVDAEPEEVAVVRERAGLQLLQFHGEEPAENCAACGANWIKAGRMRPGLDLQAFADEYAGARGLLLDAYAKHAPGGTGQTFDWARVPSRLADRVVLAGGLDAANVGAAIRQVRPYAVDVSSGVESSPGIKDQAKIQAFMRAVRAADGEAEQ